MFTSRRQPPIGAGLDEVKSLATSRSELLTVLVELARATLDEEDMVFDEATPFEDIEAWDSVSHVHMVIAMEKRFQIRFGNAELLSVVRVADLLDVISRRIAHEHMGA